MKAVVCSSSGGLEVRDVENPAPGPDGVLVRVSNAGFCGSDHSLVETGQMPDGAILGHEVSGVVTQIGIDVSGPVVGDRVIVRPTFCGVCRDCKMGKPYFCQIHRRLIGIGDLPGGFAETIRVFPGMLIPIPDGVDSQNAALAEAFAAALHGINISGQTGGSALVIGGGPIGLATLKLLRLMGFGPIALSEPVPEKRELGRRFGADLVLDPHADDLRAKGNELTGGVGYETVYECSGVPENIQAAIDVAARGATVCIVSVIFSEAVISPIIMTFKEIRLTASYANTHEENIQCLEWMAAGKLDGRDMISDRIGLEDLPEVYRERINTGKAVKVMLQIGEEF